VNNPKVLGASMSSAPRVPEASPVELEATFISFEVYWHKWRERLLMRRELLSPLA